MKDLSKPQEMTTPLTKDWSMVSSQVWRTSYKEDTEEMTIQFQSKGNPIWVYSPVPMGIWKESLGVPSIGKYLNQKIKPNYSARKTQ